MKKHDNSAQFFYQNSKIITISQSGRGRTIFRTMGTPLAEETTGDQQQASLLGLDHNDSVLSAYINTADEKLHSYSVYGDNLSLSSSHRICGFNGERMDMEARGYLLGNGYRLYQPSLMRFPTPDNMSPFGDGGLNAYCYCLGDPINRTDPSGHISLIRALPNISKWTRNTFGHRARQKYTVTRHGDNTPSITHAVQKRLERYNNANLMANSEDRRGAVPMLDELRKSLENPPTYQRALELLDATATYNPTRSASSNHPLQSLELGEFRRPSDTPNRYLTNTSTLTTRTTSLSEYEFSPEEIVNRIRMIKG